MLFWFFFFFFFFQAEDGIRDRDVTGVQTCALPISGVRSKWLVTSVGGSASPARMQERIDSVPTVSVSSSTLYCEGTPSKCVISADRISALNARGSCTSVSVGSTTVPPRVRVQ